MSAPTQLTPHSLQQFPPCSSRHALLVLPAPDPSTVKPPVKGAKKGAGSTAGGVRIVVGDDTSCVTSLSVQRGGAVEVDFRYTLPASASGGSGARIECLALGGTSGARDRVFVSSGGTVTGLSRKGKEFFTLATVSADPLRHVVLDGACLYGTGDLVYTAYDASGRDVASTACPDRIGALTLAWPGAGSGEGAVADVLVGCADRVVRLLGAGGVLAECAVEGAVTALVGWAPRWGGGGFAPPPRAPGQRETPVVGTAPWHTLAQAAESAASKHAAPPPRYFLYGTATGHVGLIVLHAGPQQRPRLAHVWSFGAAPAAGEGAASCVNAIACFPLLEVGAGGAGAGAGGAGAGGAGAGGADAGAGAGGPQGWPFGSVGDGSGTGEIIVARDAGLVEVYSLEGAGESGGGFQGDGGSGSGAEVHPPLPRLVAFAALQESVRCVAAAALHLHAPAPSGGAAASPEPPGAPDVIALTYSGRLLALSLEPPRDDAHSAAMRAAQMASLNAAVGELRKTVAARHKELEAAGLLGDAAKAALAAGAAAAAGSSSGPAQFFPMQHRLEATASWTLDPSDAAYTVRAGVPGADLPVFGVCCAHL